MGDGDWLQLHIEQRCEGSCSCVKAGDITASRSDTPGSAEGFIAYTHEINEGTFTLKRTLYGGNKIGEGDYDIEHVKSVSVYYWSMEETRPIILEIITKNTDYSVTTTYYGKDKDDGSNHWNGPLEDEHLAKKFDELNCEYYKLATMNITQSNSVNLSQEHAKDNGGNKYCCSGGHDRVSVDRVTISCENHNSSRITFYKHSITDKSKLAGIYYKGKYNIRRHITATDLQFPIKGSLSVYTFYCNQKDPVLIYVNSIGSQGDNVTGWYKNGIGDTWTKADELRDIKPEYFGDLDCKSWGKLLDTLKEFKCVYSTCTTKSGNSLSGLGGDNGRADLPGDRGVSPNLQYIPGIGSQPHPVGDSESEAGAGKTLWKTVSDTAYYGLCGTLLATLLGKDVIKTALELAGKSAPGLWAVLSLGNPADAAPVGKGTGGNPDKQDNVDTQDGTETVGSASSGAVPLAPGDQPKPEGSSETNPSTTSSGSQASASLASRDGDTNSGGSNDPQDPGRLITEAGLTGASLYGVISGVFGGSGAAGFAGWKLYKSFKQDPWVRQI